MKKQEIASRMARESGVSRAEAADRLDRVVHQILSNLRRGKEAALPGLGAFTFERSQKRGARSPEQEVRSKEQEGRGKECEQESGE